MHFWVPYPSRFDSIHSVLSLDSPAATASRFEHQQLLFCRRNRKTSCSRRTRFHARQLFGSEWPRRHCSINLSSLLERAYECNENGSPITNSDSNMNGKCALTFQFGRKCRAIRIFDGSTTRKAKFANNTCWLLSSIKKKYRCTKCGESSLESSFA